MPAMALTIYVCMHVWMDGWTQLYVVRLHKYIRHGLVRADPSETHLLDGGVAPSIYIVVMVFHPSPHWSLSVGTAARSAAVQVPRGSQARRTPSSMACGPWTSTAWLTCSMCNHSWISWVADLFKNSWGSGGFWTAQRNDRYLRMRLTDSTNVKVASCWIVPSGERLLWRAKEQHHSQRWWPWSIRADSGRAECVSDTKSTVQLSAKSKSMTEDNWNEYYKL